LFDAESLEHYSNHPLPHGDFDEHHLYLLDEDGQPIDDSAAPVTDAPAPSPPNAGVFRDEGRPADRVRGTEP